MSGYELSRRDLRKARDYYKRASEKCSNKLQRERLNNISTLANNLIGKCNGGVVEVTFQNAGEFLDCIDSTKGGVKLLEYVKAINKVAKRLVI